MPNRPNNSVASSHSHYVGVHYLLNENEQVSEKYAQAKKKFGLQHTLNRAYNAPTARVSRHNTAPKSRPVPPTLDRKISLISRANQSAAYKRSEHAPKIHNSPEGKSLPNAGVKAKKGGRENPVKDFNPDPDKKITHDIAPQGDIAQKNIALKTHSVVITDLEKENKKIAASLIAGTAILGTAAGVGTAIASGTSNIDTHSYWDHILKKNDVPWNEKPLIIAHNAGTEPGSGTIIPVSSQNMSIQEILEKTPTRGIELDIWNHEGQLVINHGGIYDPLVSNPKTVDSALGEVQQFLNNEAFKDEIVYIDIENNADIDSTALLKEKFGDQVFTDNDLAEFEANHGGRWPTSDELLAMNKRVIATSTTGRAPAPWEDLTIMGEFGQGLHPEIAPAHTIEEIDQWITNGGAVKLDKIDPFDPRFFRPEDRKDLIWKSNISIATNLFHLGSGPLGQAVFAASVGMATAGGVAAAGLGFFHAFKNHQYINNTQLHLQHALKKLDQAEVLSYKGNKFGFQFDEVIIKKLLREKMLGEITLNTVKPGITSTLGIAASLMSIASLFPPAFPILAPISGVIALAGVTFTAIETYVNRKKLNKNLDQAFENEDFNVLLKNKITELKKDHALNPNPTELKTKRWLDRLSTFSLVTAFWTLAIKTTSLAKYTVPLIGKIANGTLSAISFIATAIGITTNYLERKKKYIKIADTTINLLQKNMDKRRFLFFGKTRLQRYALKKGKDLETLEEIRKNNTKEYQIFVENFQKYTLHNSLQKFKNKKRLQGMPEEEIFIDYIKNKIGNFSKTDTLYSGLENTIKLNIGIGAFSFISPPLVPIVTSIAFVGSLIGFGVSYFTAVIEKERFKARISKLLSNEVTLDAADQQQADRLKAFIEKNLHLVTELGTQSLVAEYPPSVQTNESTV